MSSSPRVRVVRTRTSSSSFKPGIRYEYPVDCNDNIIYIREPTPAKPNSQERTRSVPLPLEGYPVNRKRSCVKRICAGLVNFFRFKTTNVGYNEELRYPSPALCYGQGGTFPLQTSCTSVEPNHSVACRSLTNFDGWNREKDQQSDDGEYIIYIPKMSRAKLQQKYVDPLRRASYDPVIIHPICRECVGCHSCNLEGGRAQKNAVRNQTRESSDPGISRQRKKSRFYTSRNPSVENVQLETGVGSEKVQCIGKESKNASGDSTERYPPTRKLAQDDSGSDKEDSKNTNFLYIPTTVYRGGNRRKRKQHPFRIREKNICWDAIQERHNRVARNRQSIMQERKDKLQTQFAIWMRRKLIGQMKKKLTKDNKSCELNPPNMLESRYHHIHWLGSSGNLNNSVGRYFDKEDNNVVALKIFSDKPFETVAENLDNKLMAIQEINSLKTMNHKNIVKLLGYFELHDKFHLILESCDHSLREEIEKNPSGLGTSVSKRMIKHVLQGLHFCHHVNCLHRDLSPENILVCKSGVVKIADFDRSVFLTETGVGSTSPTPGSFVYNSPEILAGDKKYGLPSDVWSLGVIFCEMLIGRPPWNGKSAQSQLREIHNSVGPLLPRHASIAKLQTEGKGNKSYTVQNHAQLQQMFTTISSACQSFIMKCLDVNPLCRFTCGELLQHQFIKENKKR